MIIGLIGFVGMFLILLAFFMEQTHRWKDDSKLYGAANALGGLLMVVYAILIRSYPFLVLNVAWTGVSVRDIFIGLKRSKAHIGHKRRGS